MNIHNEIVALLDSLGCEYYEAEGIYYVKTPEGIMWDFTIPQVNIKLSEVLSNDDF